jgi:hypothetical protein
MTVNETLMITVELDISSQAADFINQILSFLAYSGSSIVKTESNLFSHVADRVEVEILASVGGFLVL